MTVSDHLERHRQAASDFDEIQNCDQGVSLVESISAGLNTVRDLGFRRIHHDVELHFGLDSMVIPLSLGQSEQEAKVEIEIWQVVEGARFAHASRYVDDDVWMQKWLGHLRLGRTFENVTVQHRVEEYWGLEEEDRRRFFSQTLERVYPEASRAPLVLFQLMPLAVRTVVATAFGRIEDASQLRKEQAGWLPGIMDCPSCHGAVLGNGERCPECENPVWSYKWLLSAD